MSFSFAPEWMHVQYAEKAQFTEVYGFAGSQGTVNCEGIRYVPKGNPSKALAVYMHPATTLQLLPMPSVMAGAGVHVLCAGSRFAKNDTPLIMEKVVLDLGAYIRHAKERWGYEHIVLCGRSGGGSRWSWMAARICPKKGPEQFIRYKRTSTNGRFVSGKLL